jgi:hypothetical protein
MDLLACSLVPQPTTLPRAPIDGYMYHKIGQVDPDTSWVQLKGNLSAIELDPFVNWTADFELVIIDCELYFLIFGGSLTTFSLWRLYITEWSDDTWIQNYF